jgi:predicted GIY-YIG superfamily endonuclease
MVFAKFQIRRFWFIVMSYVYLLHFEKPISDRHTTQHYIGYTSDIDERLRSHRKGTGSRLCAVAKERGIGFTLAELIKGDRTIERTLKNAKNSPKMCPICSKVV